MTFFQFNVKFFNLKCPIRDLPTFYQEDVQEGSSYLIGGMGKINASRFGTTTNASFHYEYRVDPAMHQSMRKYTFLRNCRLPYPANNEIVHSMEIHPLNQVDSESGSMEFSESAIQDEYFNKKDEERKRNI